MRPPRPELRAPGAAIVREGRAAAAAGDLAALVAADLRFHLFVYEAAGNPLLLETARQHWHHTRRAMTAYVRRAGAMRGVWAEHAAILDAIVRGDADRAAILSHDHAANSAGLLLAAPLETRAGPSPGAPPASRRPAA